MVSHTAISEYSIFLGGLLTLSLAIFHCFFYSYFRWEDELKHVSVLTGKIFMTLHTALIAIFLFFAALSFVYTSELSQCNGLAGGVTVFYAFVWLFRTVWQVTYLGKFKEFKPVLHIVLIVWFIVLFFVYAIPVACKML